MSIIETVNVSFKIGIKKTSSMGRDDVFFFSQIALSVKKQKPNLLLL